MTDSALCISSLTAGTAVLASWVTSRGTARAAQIQAHTAEKTQRAVRVGETRRSAYVSLIEQAHRMAELYWKVSDIHQSAGPRTEQLPALKEVRTGLREEYGKLRHFIWVITLAGRSPSGPPNPRRSPPPAPGLLCTTCRAAPVGVRVSAAPTVVSV